MDYTSVDFKIPFISHYSLYISGDYIKDELVVIDDNEQVLLVKTYDTIQPPQDVAKLLSLPFPKVYITLPHQQLIWVPTDVFRESDLNDFVPFFENGVGILSKEFDTLGVTALYQYDLLLYNRWNKIYANAQFVPVFEVTLQQVQPQIPIRGSVLGVYVYDREVDLFLFVDGEFKFYNTFEAATIDDMSYFVLQLFKNFGITDRVDKILLGGIGLQSAWTQRLALYSEELELIRAKQRWTINADDASDDMQIDSFHVLADSVLCV